MNNINAARRALRQANRAITKMRTGAEAEAHKAALRAWRTALSETIPFVPDPAGVALSALGMDAVVELTFAFVTAHNHPDFERLYDAKAEYDTACAAAIYSAAAGNFDGLTIAQVSRMAAGKWPQVLSPGRRSLSPGLAVKYADAANNATRELVRRRLAQKRVIETYGLEAARQLNIIRKGT